MIVCALEVHRNLGPGFLEAVYQRSLARELLNNKIEHEQLVPLRVQNKGDTVGRFVTDFIVENQLILELKTSTGLTVPDEAQLVNYLKATGFCVGLLLNFGTPSL